MLVVAIGILALFVGFILLLLFIYQKRKFEHRQNLIRLEEDYKREMLTTALEVKEQTLSNVSAELHDNIGQVLLFVKLNLGMVASKTDDNLRDLKIAESRDQIGRVIADLRDLHRSLSTDNILRLGFANAVTTEAERINRSQLLHVDLQIEGEPVPLGKQRELVLYRIVQETINNTLKHADAKNFKMRLLYCKQLFTLTLEDDGKGFDTDIAIEMDGAGLRNIKHRANLIGASVEVNSNPGKGTITRLELDPKEEQYDAEGNYTSSTGWWSPPF